MSRITALCACNSSGPHNVEEAASHGITAYDRSHAKLEWVNDHPMDDDKMLPRQAEAVFSADPGVPGEQPRARAYRNKTMASSWHGQAREKLDDPRHTGWLARLRDYKGVESNNSYYPPACDWYGDSKSGPPGFSGYYHDQTQSPTHTSAQARTTFAESNATVETRALAASTHSTIETHPSPTGGRAGTRMRTIFAMYVFLLFLKHSMFIPHTQSTWICHCVSDTIEN